MAVAPPGKGKRAETRYRVVERFRLASVEIASLECQLGTGRTHQIRVHLASLGHPLIGDDTYDRRPRRPADPALARLIANLDGVALHAARLRFVHPATGTPVELVSPLPPRLSRLLSHLRLLSAPF